MAEEMNLNLAKQIEKLIVDGNKEVIDRVEKKLEETKQGLRQEFKADLKQEFQNLENKVKKGFNDLTFEVKTLDTSVRAAHYDIKEIDRKLDEHIKQPAH